MSYPVMKTCCILCPTAINLSMASRFLSLVFFFPGSFTDSAVSDRDSVITENRKSSIILVSHTSTHNLLGDLGSQEIVGNLMMKEKQEQRGKQGSITGDSVAANKSTGNNPVTCFLHTLHVISYSIF